MMIILNKVSLLIFSFIVIFGCYDSAAFNIENELSKQDKSSILSENQQEEEEVVVGFLSTKYETFEGEYDNPKLIIKMLESFGVKVILIDYNEVVDFDKIDDFSKLTYIDVIKKGELIKGKIYSRVEKFITDYKINRIFIPGNYYNVSSEPLPPTPYRQLVTDALVKVVDRNPNINFMAICGGLQGVMVARGIDIVRVENIFSLISSFKVIEESHVSALPHPKAADANLHKMKINLNSRLASIALENGATIKNDSLFLYFPDNHHEAINLTQSNMRKLNVMGYKIVSFSEDGIIEALEDSRGNIYFQNHPEYLALNYSAKCGNDKRVNVSINISLAILKDFLYRK